jgi:alkanesulfonate monooxygenase SsuD/methylene tetrahydromethanopterin reductase-like flavin-dependent oxidoreductase (luciferase family)
MGSKEKNFYNALARRMGYDEAADEVQRLFLDRRHREAAEAVPFEFIDRTSLIGPRERIRDRLAAYAEAGVTTLSVASYAGSLDERVAALRTLAEVLDESGLGDATS